MEQIKDLNVTRDRLMLQMYEELAKSEGLSLRDFILKYNLGTPKRKKID